MNDDEDAVMRAWLWTLFLAFALTACVVDGGEAENPEDDGGIMMMSGGTDDADSGPMMMGEVCATADDCSDARPACALLDGAESGRCVECTANDQCTEGNEICGANFTCDATENVCRDPFDCAADRPQCSLFASGSIGVCVECTGDDDCGGARPVCATTGDCVAAGEDSTCSEDAQCGPLRACVEGACVEA